MRFHSRNVFVVFMFLSSTQARAQTSNQAMPVYNGNSAELLKSIDTAKRASVRIIDIPVSAAKVQIEITKESFFGKVGNLLGEKSKILFDFTRSAIDSAVKADEQVITNRESHIADPVFDQLSDSVRANESANRDYSDPSTDTLGNSIKMRNCQYNQSACPQRPPTNASSTSEDDQKIINDRAAYDDKNLCKKSLILCSFRGWKGLLTGQDFLSDTKTCSNNVVDPSAPGGKRSIGIVLVKCNKNRPQILRQWAPNEYSGTEIIQCRNSETCYFGEPHSNYCVPCP